MSRLLNTVIVDDDKFQLSIVADFVNQTNFLKLSGTFTCPIQALDFIGISKPDLLILDVEMPSLSGFELLKSLSHPPATIIITGSKTHAVKAFDLDIVDYLVKPIDDFSRFLRALNKIRERIVPRENLERNAIYIKDNSLLVNVKFDEIQFLEAYGDYVKIATEKKVFVIYSTLSKIESRLPEQFTKTHRSYIVNTEKIENIDQFNLQIGDKIIPISKAMRTKLMKNLDIF